MPFGRPRLRARRPAAAHGRLLSRIAVVKLLRAGVSGFVFDKLYRICVASKRRGYIYANVCESVAAVG